MAFGISTATWAMVGAATAAVGAVSQGQAAGQAADYNAQVAQQNAVIAQQQGDAAAQAQSRDAQRKIGSMIASYGASGVQADAGSPLDVLADSVRMATLDNLTTKYNYALKAQGFGNQATLDTMNAETSRTSGLLNGAAALMKGGTAIPTFGAGSTTTMA